MFLSKEMRDKVRPYRDEIMSELMKLDDYAEVQAVGDSEICLSYDFNNRYRNVSLECDYYGQWVVVESQQESANNYHYQVDLGLNYDAEPEKVIKAITDLNY